jgi:hypothetical protein
MAAPTSWIGDNADKTKVCRFPRQIIEKLVTLRNEGMRVEHVCALLDEAHKRHVAAYEQAIKQQQG